MSFSDNKCNLQSIKPYYLTDMVTLIVPLKVLSYYFYSKPQVTKVQLNCFQMLVNHCGSTNPALLEQQQGKVAIRIETVPIDIVSLYFSLPSPLPPLFFSLSPSPTLLRKAGMNEIFTEESGNSDGDNKVHVTSK